VVVVEHNLDVAIPVPVDAAADAFGALHRVVGAREAELEGVLVEVERVDARRDLEAPSTVAVQGVERPSRRDAAESRVLAVRHPRSGACQAWLSRVSLVSPSATGVRDWTYSNIEPKGPQYQ
jgi:hypothetical protein